MFTKLFFSIARAFYGIGIAGLGIQQFQYADFRPVILPAWPAWMHASPVPAYLVGALWVLMGFMIAFGKKIKTVSLLLGGLLLLFFVCFQLPYTLFTSPNAARHLGVWVNPLKELALSGGAFVMAGFFNDGTGTIPKSPLLHALQSLVPYGRIFFSITLFVFGYSHFIYPDFVAGLVPAWIPGHLFWTYLSGILLMGTGAAIILKFKVKQVGWLAGLMLLLWVILLHIPRSLADPCGDKGNEITSVFEALAFSGTSFVISGLFSKKHRSVA